MSNFMTICAVGAELLHADLRTDRHDDANSVSRNFSKSA